MCTNSACTMCFSCFVWLRNPIGRLKWCTKPSFYWNLPSNCKVLLKMAISKSKYCHFSPFSNIPFAYFVLKWKLQNRTNVDENTLLCSPPKPIIRESKLVLNQKLLEDLRNPEEQVEFYHAIQKSMQNAKFSAPKLVEGMSSTINPGNF